MHREWVEPVLARELGPVAAPAELWDRILRTQAEAPAPRETYSPQAISRQRQVGQALPPANEFFRSLMLAGATLAVLLSIWADPPRKEFRSTDATAVRAWVRAQAGVDLPLRSHLPAELRLTSARVVKGRTEIAYRVGNREGRLVVGGPKMATAPLTFSGTVQGRPFTLSCADPEDLRISCALCHIG